MTGIICINKPKDITSFGVVAKMRGITREKKAGHTGTLDPMATGVLPIMFGGATRFLDYLVDSDKGYRATFKLGMTTDTLDITGKVLSNSDVNVNEKDVINVLSKFRGEICQIPPMYSAVSIDGNRLYDLARKGIEVEREERKVTIKSLELVSNSDSSYTIDVFCSKGTYIRTLIDDIGRELGCGAVMTELTRTHAMGFSIENAVTIEEMQKRKDEGTGFNDILISVEEMFKCYKELLISSAQSTRFANGGALDLNRVRGLSGDKIYRVYSPEELFLGLGEVKDDELKVLRLLTKRD